MSIEGRLSITLDVTEESITPVIASSRPTQASRLFSGKEVDQVLATLPLLFNICGKAQATAAVRAIESAMGNPPDVTIEQNREAVVIAESLREHLWRILIDWQAIVGREIEQSLLSQLTRSLTKLNRLLDPQDSLATLNPAPVDTKGKRDELWKEVKTLIEIAVFGIPVSEWQRLEESEEIDAWCVRENNLATLCLKWITEKDWNRLGCSEIRPLPRLDIVELCNIVDGDDADLFISAPAWHGNCYETGPLARQVERPLIHNMVSRYGNGIRSRLVARLSEIGELITSLDSYIVGDPRIPGKVAEQGVAAVEAARGRLIHRTVMDGERIKHYRILAPTEWNFHPQGVAARSLATLSPLASSTELDQQARLIIQAIDPCVGFDLSINRGDGRDSEV